MLFLTAFVAAALVASILFPDGKADKEVRIIGSVTLLICFIGSLCVWLWTSRAYIIADEDGLRWRSIKQERSAPWNEVTDFYDLYISSTRTYGRVETTAGQVKLGDYGNQEKLRAFIQSHACNSASREWKIKNPQSLKKMKSWPQEFGYNIFWNSLLRLAALIFLFGLCIAGAWQMRDALSFQPMSLQLRVLGVVVALFIGAIPILMFVAHFAMWKNVRQRFGQHVFATSEGIVFIDKTRRIEALWDEVADYRIEQKGGFAGENYIVETTHGNWSFSSDISRFEILKQLIIEYSINAVASEWKRPIDIDGITAKNARWAEQQKAGEQNIYHFRSNTNRAMLWFFWAIGSQPLIGILFNTSFMDSKLHLPAYIYLLVVVCFASWMTYLYKHDYVATDANGISHRTPFGTKFIAWDNIESFGKSDLGFSVIVGQKTRIRFCNVIVREEQLRNEIAQRSINSQTREWHHI